MSLYNGAFYGSLQRGKYKPSCMAVITSNCTVLNQEKWVILIMLILYISKKSLALGTEERWCTNNVCSTFSTGFHPIIDQQILIYKTNRVTRSYEMIGQSDLMYTLHTMTALWLLIYRASSHVSSDNTEDPLTPSHLIMGKRVMNLPDSVLCKLTIVVYQKNIVAVMV